MVTQSDLKTTLLPATAFAVTAVTSGQLLTTNSTLDFFTVISRLPQSILWIWMNLWIFNLANQRLPQSIIEDSINKPWRAIPSGQLSPQQARHLLLASVPMVYLVALYIGGRDESVILMVLTWMYNDLEAGDEYFLLRHVINALGFATFGAGASQVACAFPMQRLNEVAYRWLAVISAAITCTIQFQDMEDQEGDLLRNRRTLPIILGDSMARRVNAAAIITFSLIAPNFWQLSLVGYLVPTILGSSIAARTLFLRTLAADKQTFQLWCLWLISLYLLPLAKVKFPLYVAAQ